MRTAAVRRAKNGLFHNPFPQSAQDACARGAAAAGRKDEIILPVVLVSWQHVDHAPEAGPAFEAAHSHVSGDQAGGGADGHTFVPAASFQTEPVHQIGLLI